jgi:hypothetical protein
MFWFWNYYQWAALYREMVTLRHSTNVLLADAIKFLANAAYAFIFAVAA